MVGSRTRQMQGRGDGPEARGLVGDRDQRRWRRFAPHLNACFLAVDHRERIVFTNALTGGWRPAEEPFMTAIITLEDHPLGTNYLAHVMHKSNADRDMHEKMGFYDGWGTVAEQLAKLVER
jgi:uncharacterized protein YndB with AHSA1/START domain